jgi:RNA recognition motif. (a.k.a. RRM, RBD, or RNP domain)
MSNATNDSRNTGDSRRRRSRGGSNRNSNNQNNDRRESGDGNRGDRGSRDSRNGGRGHSQGQDRNSRSDEFRPAAPRKYAPAKLSLWQKILKMVGLYKEPTPPSRLDRSERSERQVDSIPFPTGERGPKTNTRNARSGEGDSRPPREPREPRPPREPRKEGEQRQPKERAERAPRGDRPRGGDPKSVESTRVYVGNLSYDVTEQDLQELFKGIGGVRNIEVVYNRSTHRSKGYGFVEMLRMDEAIRAVEVLHDQPFMGRKMTVSGAKSKGQDEREDMEGRVESEPTRVVLASTSPVVPVAAEPLAEEAAPAATTLEAKYGFDEPKEKTEEA